MATNPPKDNSRKGAIKDGAQVQNPKTRLWTKRNLDTKQFMDVKYLAQRLSKVLRKRSNLFIA